MNIIKISYTELLSKSFFLKQQVLNGHNDYIFAMLSKLYLTVIGIIMQLKKSYAFIRDRYNLSQEKET